MARSYDQIQVFDPGWLRMRTVDVAELVASWGINDAGRLTCVMPAANDVVASGTAGTVLGRWVFWEHPTLGPWAGYVEDATVDFETGTIELSCAGLVNLLQHRRTAIGYGPQQTSPGGLVMRATRDTADDDAVWLATVEADESPAMVKYEWTGESVLDLLMTLVNETGEEWLATTLANGRQRLEWRIRAGSEAVVASFHEGIDMLGGRIERSIAEMTNDLLAVADDDQYALSSRTLVVSKPSILAYGRRASTRRYLGVVTESTLEPLARRELKRLTQPVEVIELAVAQGDMRLQRVREGSRVVVTSPTANRQYVARVIARSVEVTPGVATLACEVEKALSTRMMYFVGATMYTATPLPPPAGSYTDPEPNA